MRSVMLSVAAAGFIALAPQPSFAQDPLGGALVGAGVGAGIGAAVGGGRGAATGAAIGAGVGAAAGASAGPRYHYGPRAHYYAHEPGYVAYGGRSARRCWINRFGERVCKVRRYY
jgi:hypothetical protein